VGRRRRASGQTPASHREAERRDVAQLETHRLASVCGHRRRGDGHPGIPTGWPLIGVTRRYFLRIVLNTFSAGSFLVQKNHWIPGRRERRLHRPPQSYLRLQPLHAGKPRASRSSITSWNLASSPFRADMDPCDRHHHRGAGAASVQSCTPRGRAGQDVRLTTVHTSPDGRPIAQLPWGRDRDAGGTRGRAVVDRWVL